ncbi:acetoin utilization protein AcuC [Fervidibacillus albus]|uniref:Acetoin utilization protein AcuC n=1 Tax=Fervidibacillus albus TaxID=2980026 RepID=A0A9E8LWK4_9BACI|nr:acetoin utilization protein AcuC [Fervidibacillus albus]WAA10104.1 acetoin utilization protein AcuC [Fervidibacillus albus]
MNDKFAFIFSPDLLNYKFRQGHPFNQKRIELTIDLLKEIGALSSNQIIPPKMATDEELLLVHDPSFIDAVKKAGNGKLSIEQGENYGLGTDDTPMFPNMHEASAIVVGGTLTAVDYVMEKKGEHALHLGGGLHHGFRGKASGFCIYNDCSIAIQYIRKKFDGRVLYIDTDAHHGDGVQWTFYDDPNVCTVSLHETGRYLFPGTGNVYERGHGQGYGYSYNIPLDAFTEDDSFLFAYRKAVKQIADHFQPDVIITQNGADAHYFDPLTHLATTILIFREIPKLAHELAHRYAEGRWIALGGGGYDIWRVVPRAWAILWLEMTGQSEKATGPLPNRWLKKWQPLSPVKLPKTWEDPDDLYPPIPRKPEIEEKNRMTVEKALQILNK